MLGRDPRASALLDCCVSRAFCPLRSVPCKHEDTGEANAHLLFVCRSFVLITVTTPSSGVLGFIKVDVSSDGLCLCCTTFIRATCRSGEKNCHVALSHSIVRPSDL
ncbi:hypothetical protein ILYODFUR_006192 [Ilyodon furcidens]|uniref:Uncharacterized protein n=1 Tax=Ilyodon furcidens TaxID=33524 RepID=A0ABV0TTI3_9TELE